MLHIIIIGNKLDEVVQVSEKKAKEDCEELGCPHFRVSCKTGENIESTWEYLRDLLIEENDSNRKFKSITTQKPLKIETKSPAATTTKKKGGCCS